MIELAWIGVRHMACHCAYLVTGEQVCFCVFHAKIVQLDLFE